MLPCVLHYISTELPDVVHWTKMAEMHVYQCTIQLTYVCTRGLALDSPNHATVAIILHRGRMQACVVGEAGLLIIAADALLEIEEDAPPPVSKCSQCLGSCSDAMRTKCWPSLKLLLTFTIPHDSRFNTVFSILSTFLAYISVLTLSFQVSNC